MRFCAVGQQGAAIGGVVAKRQAVAVREFSFRPLTGRTLRMRLEIGMRRAVAVASMRRQRTISS